MRFALVLGILSYGLLLGGKAEGTSQERDYKELAQSAIRNATIEYDENVKLAFLGGAQSQRSQREFSKSTPYSREVGRLYNIHKKAMNELITSHGLDRPEALKLIQDALPKQCELPNAECDPLAKYRTPDGTCNNLENPHWGAVNSPNGRLIEPAYQSINDEPRGGLHGEGLPPPRSLSLTVHQGNGLNYESKVTHMVAQFGQFLDHDFTITPVESLGCCDNENLSQNCWRINVTADDPHFQGFNVTCLDFVRSTPTCRPSSFERREQINGITAYIDGSMVYGSSSDLMELLRSHQGGRLKVNQEHPNFLPWDSELVVGGRPTLVRAGDVRANAMPGLTTLHTLFLREHNRVADEFANLTDWEDERIFQETRRIIGAQLQQITYNEFLPAILGKEAMLANNLVLPTITQNYGHTRYDSTMDATIISSFATAAYRFGHTLVNGLVKLILNTVPVGDYQLKDNYFISDQVLDKTTILVIANHTGFQGTGYDHILNGLITQPAQASDPEIHSDMSNDLFMNRSSGIGSDLAARNIQRGRDHGLPAYNEFRVFCGLSQLNSSWDSRPSEFTVEAWGKLRFAYENFNASPQDIDLFTGGLSETPVEGGLSGPTFVCLQAIQFKRLLFGDRFFFTHAHLPGSFSMEQLSLLRRRTLGDIICQNSVLGGTPKNVFYVADEMYCGFSLKFSNPMVSCGDPSRQLEIGPFTKEAEQTGGGGSGVSYLPIPLAIIMLMLANLFAVLVV